MNKFRLIKGPQESISRLADMAEYNSLVPGLPYPGEMADVVTPLRPGECESWIAVSGMGKTSLMLWRAIRAARLLRDTGQTDKAIVFMSWEQSIETLEQYVQMDAPYSVEDVGWGRVSRGDVSRHISERITLPLYFGGWSRFDNQTKERMTIKKVIESLQEMEQEFGKKPFHVCLDYLQLMHIEGNWQSRPKELEEAGYQVKDMAIELDCSVSLGVQANPDSVNKKSVPVPGLGDTWYTRIVDMISAKAFGFSRPIRWDNRDEGEKVSWGGMSYEIANNLSLIRMIKQRHASVSYREFGMHLDINRMELTDAPTTGISLRGQMNGARAF